MSGPIALQPRITTGIRPASVTPQRTADGRPLLPRPTLRATTATSVLGTIRTPVRAPAPKQIQTQATRPVLQKRATTTTVINTQSVSPSATSTPVAQIRPKFTVLTTPVQSKQVIKTGTGPVQQQAQTKQSPKTPVGKAQSLLSPQQKLLMAKRKAQEAAGIIKPGGRGLLAGARAGATAGRSRAKVGETPSAITQAGAKLKESKLAEGDGLHMEFHEVGSEESSSEGEPDLPPPPESDTVTAPEPDSPPRPFTLCPLTGRIIGPDGEPIEQTAEQPEPEPTISPSSTATLSTAIKTTTTVSETTTAADAVAATTTTVTNTTTTTTATATATSAAAAAAAAELVLPSLDSLTESGIMRVEMSPGGTTGTIVQTSETTAQMNLSNVAVPAPDLPCLDDTAPTIPTVPTASASTPLTENTGPPAETSITTALSTVTAATSTVTMSVTSADVKTDDKISEERKVTTDDASNLVTIADAHGVVYQVAGQAEDGQTLLVTRGADGEQQCVYVTTEQQGDDGSVLTFDQAVAQLIPEQVNLTPQFFVKEDGAEPTENSMMMSIMDNANAADVTGAQEDNDGQAQVVAQVVQAEEPTPGGTRKVVLLLPDGNFMVTEVDEEQYAALELDK
ncbi:chromodomain y-like protein [Lasius niger]|uniref:Chromodomain y-like protein n=1 Tax=Lasius niger TaxID=67767 RepID=A0A0J7KUQ4_LASNI|nr:chromodomain y-like protein [Lasius niger]